MSKERVYEEASEVKAEDGVVHVDGPDAVDVKITPEAAEQTGQNLIEEALRAEGQRQMKRPSDQAEKRS